MPFITVHIFALLRFSESQLILWPETLIPKSNRVDTLNFPKPLALAPAAWDLIRELGLRGEIPEPRPVGKCEAFESICQEW